jgi:hypothetical protein
LALRVGSVGLILEARGPGTAWPKPALGRVEVGSGWDYWWIGGFMILIIIQLNVSMFPEYGKVFVLTNAFVRIGWINLEGLVACTFITSYRVTTCVHTRVGHLALVDICIKRTNNTMQLLYNKLK